MTSKEFLERAEKAESEICLLLDKIKAFRRSAYVKGAQYTHSMQGNKSAAAVSVNRTITEYERQLDKLIIMQTQNRKEIEKVISEITDKEEKEFLQRKYLIYQPIEGVYDDITGDYKAGITDAMKKSTRQIYRIQARAFQSVEFILKLNC